MKKWLVDAGLLAILGTLTVALVSSCTNSGDADAEDSAAAPSSGSVGFGREGPSWLTQDDMDAYAAQLAEIAEHEGIAEDPPAIVRWVHPNESQDVTAACFEDLGFVAEINYAERSVDIVGPAPVDETAKVHAYWTCYAKYPVAPDREHGQFSDRTKEILYEYNARELVE
ncbi:MAG: hypothetical protein LBK72_09210, partial [Bifidobacteriaceae bacterium]|nr:hypothetical protein [Bifidobacteriaceae bacterium]